MVSRKFEQEGDWISEISLEIGSHPHKSEPEYDYSWALGPSYEQERLNQDVLIEVANVENLAHSQPNNVAGGTVDVQIRVVLRAGADGRTHTSEPVEVSTLVVTGSGLDEERYSLRCTYRAGRRATGGSHPPEKDQTILPKS